MKFADIASINLKAEANVPMRNMLGEVDEIVYNCQIDSIGHIKVKA
ncbi:hypothetical protein [Chondrinema litorale]|nr:hypothetical protein [Chondrinema litorale]UZR93748.1 hypothetical protein OQ292_18025 [Chondrinema litorale]